MKYKTRRAITAEEHAKIIESERMEDYAQFFCLLWETSGSQIDIAHLKAEDIDWMNNRLYYSRRWAGRSRGGSRPQNHLQTTALRWATKSISALVHYARASKKRIRGIEHAIKSARQVARSAGHDRVSFADIRAAMIERTSCLRIRL